jgi:hypothetical protein
VSEKVTLTFCSRAELANLIESHARTEEPSEWLDRQEGLEEALHASAAAFCTCGWFGDTWADHLTDVLVWAGEDDGEDEDDWWHDGDDPLAAAWDDGVWS